MAFYLFNSNNFQNSELVEKIKVVRAQYKTNEEVYLSDTNDLRNVKEKWEQYNKNEVLYLSATANLRDIRAKNFFDLERECYSFSSDMLKIYEENLNSKFILSYQGFNNLIKDQIKRESDLTKNLELKVDLEQAISESKFPVFEKMTEELFELFSLIEFYGDIPDSNDVLKNVANDFSITEVQIFEIYFRYHDLIKDKITFQKSYLKYQNESLKNKKAIFFDGFLFFNDEQYRLIQEAYSLGIDIYFIAKFQYGRDQLGTFLKRDNFDQIAQECSTDMLSCETLNFPETIKNSSSKLNYLQEKFPNININENFPANIADDNSTLHVYPEFLSRNEEYEFIAKEINCLIQSKLNMPSLFSVDNFDDWKEKHGYQNWKNDNNNEKKCKLSFKDQKLFNKGKDERRFVLEKIRSVLSDVCVVMAVEKEKYELSLLSVFEHCGIFVLNCHESFEKRKIDLKFHGMPFFNKNNFLKSDIYFSGDENNKLSFLDKYRLYHKRDSKTNIHKYISPISIRKESKPLTSYPIGEFVFQIYHIFNSELTIESFLKILTSNWEQTVNGDPKKNWIKQIKGFVQLQAFFEKSNSIDEWVKIAKELQELKLSKELILPEYRWHPLNSISVENIDFIKNILTDLQKIIQFLAQEGSFKEHLNRLSQHVIHHYSIQIPQENHEMSLDQQVVIRLEKAIHKLGVGVDTKVFSAKNFSNYVKGMIDDYQKENESESDELYLPLEIDVVNLENMKNYNYTFFPNFESNKYPRPYHEQFPFSPEIQKILKNEFKINQRKFRGLKYHLELETYLIKNVIDFTRKQLTITFSLKELEEYNNPSVFIEDIASMFNKNIKELFYLTLSEDSSPTLADSDNSINIEDSQLHFPHKNYFFVNELGAYIACPKSYFFTYKSDSKNNHISYNDEFQLKLYCQAVLYSNSFNEFLKKYGNKYFLITNNEYLDSFSCIVNNSNVFKFFSYLNEFEKKDIRNSVISSFQRFVEFYVKESSFKFTTPKKLKNQVLIPELRTTLKKELDVQITVPPKWQSTTLFLDFLMLVKTSLIVDENEHYHQKAQKKIGHINCYNNDGVAGSIINEVLEKNFLHDATQVSSYCRYCKVRSHCLEDCIQINEDS